MGIKQDLLDVSAAYCAATGLSESRVSTRVMCAGHRLPGLRKGKDALSGNIEAALAWFAGNWPEGVVWPPHVSRPAGTPSAPLELPQAA